VKFRWVALATVAVSLVPVLVSPASAAPTPGGPGGRPIVAPGGAQVGVRPVVEPAKKVAAQTLTWTADNDITRYKSAPTSAATGETTIVFENSEATGNTILMSHTLTFDTSTPGYNHDVNLNILANPFDANNGRHEATVTLTAGRYRYFCTIPGHSAMFGEFTVTGGPVEDETPPTVSATVSGQRDDNGDYVGSATVTVQASDTGGSGLAGVEYQVDDFSWTPYTAPVTVTAIGDHSVQFRATDGAGNVSATGSVQFSVVEPDDDDTTPPTVTATVAGERDGQGRYVGTATVTVTATDDDSGVAGIEVSVDGAPFTPYTAPVVINAPGEHMVHYRAVDNAGNVSPEGMAAFTVVEPEPQDTTPPTVTATVAGERDGQGRYLGLATVTVTASDSGSGVASTEYSLDGAAFVTYTAPVQVRATGAHTVRFRATDVAGNVSPIGQVSFTVVQPPVEDIVPPETSATVSGPRDAGGNYIGTATVTLSATDAQSGVRSVEYALDSGAWTAYSGPIAVGAFGPHSVRYRATDNANNVAAEKTVTFTVVQPGSDACPNSDNRPTVVIGGDDTGVANKDTGNGCTINDLIAENAEYPDHATFVRHVQSVTAPLVTAGIITRRDQGAIVRAAAASDVGSRSFHAFF
jgi:plastocyanin